MSENPTLPLSLQRSSIALRGHDIGGLPRVFDDFCLHSVSADVLAACIMTVHRATTDILIMCDYFVADLFLWIQAHWFGQLRDSWARRINANKSRMGKLSVSVAGKTLYEKSCGDNPAQMIIMVRSICKQNGLGHKYPVEKITIAALKDGVQVGTMLDTETKAYRPMLNTRLPMYCATSINRGQVSLTSFHWDQGLLKRNQLDTVCVCAQRMVKWLLRIPVRRFRKESSGCIAFQVIANFEESSGVTIGKLFNRIPGIVHIPFGSREKLSAPIFKGRPESITSYNEGPVTFDVVVSCFPDLETLFQDMANECRCDFCDYPKEIGKGKSGCLRETTLTAFCILLAHSLADGFGAPDTSGLDHTTWSRRAVQNMLTDLVLEDRIIWDDWFKTATVAYLGCPWDDAEMDLDASLDTTLDSGASAIVAVQYGSLVAVAKWSDMMVEQRCEGCFGFSVAEGQLDGVMRSFGVVQTERSTPFPENIANQPNSTVEHAIDKFNFNRAQASDDSEAVVQTAVIARTANVYRLVIIARSGQCLRIVDAAQVLWGVVGHRIFQCTHDSKVRPIVEKVPLNTTIRTFHELLGGWDAQCRENYREGDTEPDSYGNENWSSEVATCNTHVKVNVAMALSPRRCLIMDSDMTCLAAAITELEQDDELGGGCDSRRLINRRIDKSSLTRRHARNW